MRSVCESRTPKRASVRPLIAAGAALWLGGGVDAQPRPQSPGILIQDTQVVDVVGGTLLEHQDIRIADGRIVSVAPTAPARLVTDGSVWTIDGTTFTVLPGLWNFHTHLTLEETPGYAERSLADFVAKGVLTAVDMGGDLKRIERWRSEIAAGERIGPAILAAGPFIDGDKTLDGSEAANAWRRANMRVVRSAAEVPALVAELAPAVDLFKVHSRLPRNAFLAVAAEARRRDEPVAVHLPVGVTILDAVEAGASTIEHTISFLGDAIYAEDPAAMTAQWSSAMERLRGTDGDAVFGAVAAARTCVTPTLLATVRIARAQENEFFGRAADDLEWITRRLHERGVKLIAGSDASGEAQGHSLAEELLLELEHLAAIGLPPEAVLRAATLHPADCLGRADEGRVEAGAKADLLLVAGNPLDDISALRNMRGVILGGRYLSPPQTTPAATRARRDEFYAGVEIQTREIARGLYMLRGQGGNVAVATGPDGTLVVDTDYASLGEKHLAAIAELTGRPVEFVVNTHWHHDHADGNLAFARGGAVVAAQAASRLRMTTDQYISLDRSVQPASPTAALPRLTFDDSMRFHLGGETIDVVHLGPAHTDGDAVVFFRGSNVVHTGDLYVGPRFRPPYVDQPNGGSIEGMITATERLAALVDDSTVLIPGHGDLGTRTDLVEYTAMLRTVADRIRLGIERGQSMEEIVASRPTSGFAIQGRGTDRWVRAAYREYRERRDLRSRGP